ncbi:hypothetical protein D0868_07336 [Hortaea werneckii]|uniref:Uncharacterized protein n=1 Tax=Hortaea werneckii TaxID=91943 RepID=A0A3M7B2I1_HORWE|nr:hypothetical protein D0868_07336 [Hortaea werneckii]RMY33740.1 hypothetical protein D0866_05718 [Hortaea werneckii]
MAVPPEGKSLSSNRKSNPPRPQEVTPAQRSLQELQALQAAQAVAKHSRRPTALSKEKKTKAKVPEGKPYSTASSHQEKTATKCLGEHKEGRRKILIRGVLSPSVVKAAAGQDGNV